MPRLQTIAGIIRSTTLKGNQVRIGIDAPKNIAIHRVEIYERIKHQQHDASQGKSQQSGDPVAP